MRMIVMAMDMNEPGGKNMWEEHQARDNPN